MERSSPGMCRRGPDLRRSGLPWNLMQGLQRLLLSFTVVLVGLLIIDLQPAAAQDYSGPSLLSRGGNSPGRRGRAPVDFTFYAALRGTYETGLFPVALTASGGAPNPNISGVQAELGLYGGHVWRRTSLGVDYRGDWRQTNNAAYKQYSGDNHALSVAFETRPSARWGFGLSQVAGTSNRAFGGFSAPAFSEFNRPGIPINEFFDSRVYFLQSSAGVTYAQSARLSYSVNGGVYAVRRVNLSLVSVNGYSVSGQSSYRLTRSDTISANYTYMALNFPRVFGNSKIHVIAGGYNRRLNRNWSLSTLLGVFAADTTGTEQVALSPEVAFILGRSTGFAAYHRVQWSPRYEGTVNYTLERSRFYVGASQGATPGNGVYLTTNQRIFSGGYSYTGLRRLSLGLSAGYSYSSSLAQDIPGYKTAQTGGGLNYKLLRHLDFTTQADYRHFSAPGLRGRSGNSLAIGLAYSPSEFPLAIW